MKNTKNFVIKTICMTFIAGSLIISNSYATNYQLTLDEAIEKAVEESNDYRALKSTEESVDQQVKQAAYGSSAYSFSKEKYDKFTRMYYREPGYDDDDENDGGYVDRDNVNGENVVGPFYFQHLIDKDQAELTEYYAQLMASIAPNPADGYYPTPSYVAKVLEEEEFIMYLFQFGNEQPGLDRDERYYKFIKAEELTKLQGENGKKKYENGLLAIRNGVSAGTSQLYLQYYSALKGFEISEDNILFQRQMFNNIEKSYELGQLSEMDYQKQRKSLEIEELKLKQMALDINSLQMAFNKLLGYSLDTETILHLNQNLDEKSIKASLDETYEANIDLMNLVIDLEYSERELELMEKYLDLDEYNDDYENVKDKISDYKVDKQRIEDNIAVNYAYAIEDLHYKMQKMEADQVALKLKKKEYENGQLMYELGLLKITDLNGLGLQYMSSNMTYTNAQLAYEQSLTNMKLLTLYGVEYK